MASGNIEGGGRPRVIAFVVRWLRDLARGTAETLTYAASVVWRAFLQIRGPRSLARFVVFIVQSLVTICVFLFLAMVAAGAVTLGLEWAFGLPERVSYWLGWVLYPPMLVAQFYLFAWIGRDAPDPTP